MGILSFESWDPGMPDAIQIEEAINHICADIGAAADSLVVDYTMRDENGNPNSWNVASARYARVRPGPGELSDTLLALRALVGDDEDDYLILFGPNGDHPWILMPPNPNYQDGYTGGFPSTPELKALLTAIHDSI